MKLSVGFVPTLAASISLLVSAPWASGQDQSAPSSPPTAPLQTSVRPAQMIARLEERLPQLMKDADVPGLAIALVRDGEMVWHRGFGVMDSKTKEPVDDTTVFEAASLSKPVFAYAVLRFVDEGKFDLDKPLNQYLPGKFDVDDERASHVTARHVLSHTTGFSHGYHARTMKLHFPPGERFSYSAHGFEFLWAVIEHVSGEPLNDFVKRMVFEPLGMTSSSFTWLDTYDKRKASRHDSIGQSLGQGKPSPERANRGNLFWMHTTAFDYGRFVCAMLKGTGLRPDTRALMLKPQIYVCEGGPGSGADPDARKRSDVAWGLGWGLQTTNDGLSFWHWGDGGDIKAFVVAFDQPKMGVVFFANGANGLSVAREIVAEAVGGAQPGLDWLDYEGYNSPSRLLFKRILAQGATTALREYGAKDGGRPAAGAITKFRMNDMGHNLLRLKRVDYAVEVFKLNVALYPRSALAYDSLAEAYQAAGDEAAAIKNYRRSLELDPKNRRATEQLKELEGTKRKKAT
jgi:CubicO group peptidase (beta-lactamase class C family)